MAITANFLQCVADSFIFSDETLEQGQTRCVSSVILLHTSNLCRVLSTILLDWIENKVVSPRYDVELKRHFIKGGATLPQRGPDSYGNVLLVEMVLQ